MRHVTQVTEVSFKAVDGSECFHEGWEPCSDCEPKDLTLLGHWDIESTIRIARESNLGMYRGIPTKELIIQYYMIDQNGRRVPPKLMQHYSEEFEGPFEYVVTIDDVYQPLVDEIVNE